MKSATQLRLGSGLRRFLHIVWFKGVEVLTPERSKTMVCVRSDGRCNSLADLILVGKPSPIISAPSDRTAVTSFRCPTGLPSVGVTISVRKIVCAGRAGGCCAKTTPISSLPASLNPTFRTRHANTTHKTNDVTRPLCETLVDMVVGLSSQPGMLQHNIRQFDHPEGSRNSDTCSTMPASHIHASDNRPTLRSRNVCRSKDVRIHIVYSSRGRPAPCRSQKALQSRRA